MCAAVMLPVVSRKDVAAGINPYPCSKQNVGPIPHIAATCHQIVLVCNDELFCFFVCLFLFQNSFLVEFSNATLWKQGEALTASRDKKRWTELLHCT